MIKIILKKVGSKPAFFNVDNDLKSLQNLVGGYIEIVRVNNNLLLVCNEEGKLDGLPVNFPVRNDVIVGNVFFVRSNDEGEFIDVLETDFTIVCELVNR